ncbi:hypothetical protein, unlikely [Trypanosoma brucei gambiense DAL972]|uniref:Uncharacterized protein n=1 Tax=Trypanosoma brucei gambiense (strain MHOM/CI/86/DAL972) TaxID=679716 RepID=C9ZYY4_TRYB9|nr:hypothetical protein, unlikely [Trypanosoma brucei gambiense DAL972]CBH14633.1 hypothetical protein, unlikely [Trypanosoma brucei gambiense DAL972]|eukprot:XP_011776899.1 hypothetical protein, unlikely [Trypanosoma brucei gambiense DAL972]
MTAAGGKCDICIQVDVCINQQIAVCYCYYSYLHCLPKYKVVPPHHSGFLIRTYMLYPTGTLITHRERKYICIAYIFSRQSLDRLKVISERLNKIKRTEKKIIIIIINENDKTKKSAYANIE